MCQQMVPTDGLVSPLNVALGPDPVKIFPPKERMHPEFHRVDGVLASYVRLTAFLTQR